MEALIVCSVFGLAGWGWLLRRSNARPGLAPTGDWHFGDAVLGGAIAAYFVVSAFSGEGKEAPVTAEIIRLSIVFYLVILALLCGAVLLRGGSLHRAFGLAPARAWRAIGIGALCIALVYPLVELAGLVMTQLGHPVSSDDGMVQYFRGRPPTLDLVLAILMAVVIAPVTEELLFRGYLYGILKQYGGRAVATIATASIFAASHPNLPAFPSLFILATALALAYELTGSLWSSIVMHMLFNSATVVVLLWFPEWIH